ncbi:MAG: hypothetical protein ACI867_002171, partial [Glaciecola sp.]
MSEKRRGTGPPNHLSRKARPGVDPTEDMIERAVRSSMGKDGWTVLELDLQAVQRRGVERSHIFRARLGQGDRTRRATLVAHTGNRRPPGSSQPAIIAGPKIVGWR